MSHVCTHTQVCAGPDSKMLCFFLLPTDDWAPLIIPSAEHILWSYFLFTGCVCVLNNDITSTWGHDTTLCPWNSHIYPLSLKWKKTCYIISPCLELNYSIPTFPYNYLLQFGHICFCYLIYFQCIEPLQIYVHNICWLCIYKWQCLHWTEWNINKYV